MEQGEEVIKKKFKTKSDESIIKLSALKSLALMKISAELMSADQPIEIGV